MTRERLGPAVTVGDLTLVPVERISLASRRWGGGALFFGSKRPVAMLVRRGDREWRLDIPWDAEEAGDGAEAGGP